MKKKKEEEIIKSQNKIQQMSTLIDKIKSLEEELNLAKEENNKVESLEIQLKQAEEENEIWQNKVRDYENSINKINVNLDNQQLNTQNAILKNKNIQLQNENISLQNQIEKIKEQLSNQIKEKAIIDDRMKKIINSGFDDNDTQEQLKQKIAM